MCDRWTARLAAVLLGAFVGMAALSCSADLRKSANPLAAPAVVRSDIRTILDFEQPNPKVALELSAPPAASAPVSQPASAPAPDTLTRSSLRPNTGLWSLQSRLLPSQPAEIVHHFANPVDLQTFDTIFASVLQMADPSRSNEWTAAVYLEDSHGKRVMGDPRPITTRWQALPLDAKTAMDEGLDLGHVTSMGVAFRPAPRAPGTTPATAPEPLMVQTDTWEAKKDQHAYVGQRLGPAKSFYVQRSGTRLSLGMVGQYELTFHQRAGIERPWMTLTQNAGTLESPERRLVLGQAGTGLMLLDQDRYDALHAGLQETAFDPGKQAPLQLPPAGWPVDGVTQSEWSWECTWSSPVAAIVEVKQEVGPFDRLGQPTVALKWRFMVYQWGQIFVHVEWVGKPANGAAPISWALLLDAGAARTTFPEQGASGSAADQERLLSAIYPATVRQGWTTALPHQMQTNAAVAMIAKGAKNRCWWAAGGGKQLFGVGVTQQQGPLDCMLLVNSPTALRQAGSFSAYLSPPKVRVRQGEVDRNFPGDFDNDGLVEPYGFQVVRLANGRTSFTIYPQERPLFYPAFLFTVPAVERDILNVKNARVLINIDGKQFEDPPAFPDGSYLLQMPYVLNQPVQVEAILVHK